MLRWLVISAFAFLMLAACSEPRARETFLRSDGSGEYSFHVELNDTTASYTLSFYTAIDRVDSADTLVSFPMHIIWRAPSGRFFSETVYYPADSLRVCYRRGLIPGESGSWTLSVSVAPEPQGMRGLGLIVERDAKD